MKLNSERFDLGVQVDLLVFSVIVTAPRQQVETPKCHSKENERIS